MLSEQHPQQSRWSMALWVPVVWYAIEASRSVSRWLVSLGYSIPGVENIEGSPIDRAVYSVLLGLGLAILFSRRINWASIRRCNPWLFTFFLYMLVSALWSDLPVVSLKRWIRTFGDVVMALVVLTERDSFEAVYVVLRRVLTVAIVLSIVFIKYYRGIGTAWDYLGNEMWVGVTTHKNVLGEVAMTAGIYFLAEIVRNVRAVGWRNPRVWFYVFFLYLTLWVLKGSPSSRSTTSLALFITGALALLVLNLNHVRANAAYIRRYLVLGVLFAGFLLLMLQAFTAFSDKSVVAATLSASDRDVTLTGRTELWSDLLKIASDHPILGLGYGGFWVGNPHGLWNRHIWKPNQAHNGYIDVYVQLGIIGLILLGGLIVSSYRNVLNEFSRDYTTAAFRLTLLTLIICHNLTESSLFKGTVDLWFVFLLVAIKIPNKSPDPAAQPVGLR